MNKNLPDVYILKEDQFSFDKFVYAWGMINQDLDKFLSNERPDPMEEYYGIYNWMLTIKGYGLIKERDILKLKLANAIINEDIVKLEMSVQRASQAVDDFISNHTWVVID